MGALLLSSLLLAATPAPRPVVLELFTSEGCSSCPPADEALKLMDGTAAAEGVEVIALALHVDYWNRLGWKDPFSDAAYSARQQRYQDHAKSDTVYTPHFLVNGRTVKTSSAALRSAFEAAKSEAFVPVKLNLTGTAEDLEASIVVPPMPARATLLLAVTEKNLVSKVTAGENEGKTLQLGPVVRKLVTVAPIDPKGVKITTKVPLEKAWDAKNTALVVLLQNDDLKIVGAARAFVPPAASK